MRRINRSNGFKYQLTADNHESLMTWIVGLQVYFDGYINAINAR
jgi:hypothetical protein